MLDNQGIYAICCDANSKVYIGSARNIKNRLKRHKTALTKGTHHSIKLQRAWGKYGEDSFTFSLIERVFDPNDLVPREQAWFDFLCPAVNGYNISPTAGSSLGTKRAPISEETRVKMSSSQQGRKHNPETLIKIGNAHRGTKKTDEAKKKISEKAIGRKQSEETISKRVAKNKGQKRTEKQCLTNSKSKMGHKLSEETKDKIRQKAIGRKTSDETKEKLSRANKNKVISRETVLKRAKTIEQMVANGIYEKVGFILIRKVTVGEAYQR